MSDKPTVEPFDAQLHHPSCSQHDRDLIWFCNQCGAKESADEWHNAALAASLPDERWVTQQLQAANKLCEGLQQQIAAERELRERAEANMRVFIEKEHTPIVEQLRQQLAAERETSLIRGQRADDAERQVQTLVDALKEIRGLVTLRRIHQIVDAALAKVKEGK